MMFLVLLRHSGTEWDVAKSMDEQSKWLEHASYMDELVDTGVIILGGPLDDIRVALAIEATTEAALRDILARDPWSKTHLNIDCVDAWSIRLDGRTGRQ
ncbi:MAG TPA: hypothetical protein VIJ40_03245 [Acidimicrobiales bacterium]